MSAETKENSFLKDLKSRVASIEMINEDGRVGVARDIEHAGEEDLGSPVAESVKSARKELQEDQHETKFDLYDAMLDLDPELSGAVNAIAQSASDFEVVAPVDKPGDRGEEALQECRMLAEKIGAEMLAIDILRNLIRYGNDINKKVYEEGIGIKKLQALPVNSTTIVDDKADIQDIQTESQFEKLFGDAISQQEAEEEELETDMLKEVYDRKAYVLNEASEGHHSVIDNHNVQHFSIDARSNWHEDRLGRKTFGVWGKSRLESLEFTIQTKYNTLTNKVAMDDKLIAREIYYINTTELFGDINDFEERKKKAQAYAKEIKKMIEGLGPDERPMLPEHVDVEVIGPEGKAIDQQPFIEQLNNSIAAALTFPMAGLGRGTTSVKAGEEISSLWAENNIKNLRRTIIRGFREIFRDHLKLVYNGEGDREDWVENRNEAENIGEMKLDPEIPIPTLKYEPFKEDEMTAKARQVKFMYQTKTASAAERREHIGLPTDDESIEELKEEFPKLDGEMPEKAGSTEATPDAGNDGDNQEESEDNPGGGQDEESESPSDTNEGEDE